MSRVADLKSWWSKTSPLQLLPRAGWAGQRPTFRDAQPAIIDAALQRSQARASGNWYALAASASIRRRPHGTTVGGREIVAWRGMSGDLHVGPGACPHLGADLSTGKINRGALICPWHGLRLDGRCRVGWQTYPAHDDGLIAWVRLDDFGAEPPAESPVVPQRPDGAHCTPWLGSSVFANRAISSPTGSTLGMGPGFTRTRSPGSTS